MNDIEDVDNIKQLLDSKKKTYVVEARIDARTIASLIEYFHQRLGMRMNRSAMLRTAVEVYVNTLIMSGKIVPVTSTYDAFHIIRNAGYPIGRVGLKNNMFLSQEMQKETLEADSFDPTYMDSIKTIKESDIYKKAAKILEEKHSLPIGEVNKDDIMTVQPEAGVKEQAGAIAGLPDQATIDKARKVTSRN